MKRNSDAYERLYNSNIKNFERNLSHFVKEKKRMSREENKSHSREQ